MTEDKDLRRGETMIDVQDHLQEEMTGSWRMAIRRIVTLSCLGGDLDLLMIETVLLLEQDHLYREDHHLETFERDREVLHHVETIEVALPPQIGDEEVLLLLQSLDDRHRELPQALRGGLRLMCTLIERVLHSMKVREMPDLQCGHQFATGKGHQ